MLLPRAEVVGDREKQAETKGTWGVACSPSTGTLGRINSETHCTQYLVSTL